MAVRCRLPPDRRFHGPVRSPDAVGALRTLPAVTALERTPLAIAHRAGNSLAALAAALEAGVDVVEADVHAHEGRLEVRHLKTMGPIPYLWDTWSLVPAAAPRLLLDEVLQAVKPGTLFMLDVKGKPEQSADVAVAAATAVHEIAPGHDVIVCGRRWAGVDAVADRSYVRPVYSARTRRELAGLRTLVTTTPAYGVSVHRSLLTPALVAELHRRVEVVMTWPVNTSAVLTEVLELGVGGVISDELEVLDALRWR